MAASSVMVSANHQNTLLKILFREEKRKCVSKFLKSMGEKESYQ